MISNRHSVSILSTFYVCILRQYFCAKNYKAEMYIEKAAQTTFRWKTRTYVKCWWNRPLVVCLARWTLIRSQSQFMEACIYAITYYKACNLFWCQGGNSQNFLRKFVRFFVNLGLRILRLLSLKVVFDADIIKGRC